MMKTKSLFRKIKLTLLVVTGGVVFFWLVVVRLIAKFAGGHPCPYAWRWLTDNSIRRRYMCPVLDRVGIRPGETVLELGPGPGAFTIDAARRMGPQGRLIAVDIQPKMIAQVEKRVRHAGLTNVETHVASAYDLPIEDASVDRAFLVTVLPEIPDPVRGLREVYRVLKPGGVFSTTEEFLDPDYPRRKTSIAWAEAAGFEMTERFGNAWVYTLNFQKSM
jgi:ubiquinone/menaquinone biosynthesis C-methylase UbiE